MASNSLLNLLFRENYSEKFTFYDVICTRKVKNMFLALECSPCCLFWIMWTFTLASRMHRNRPRRLENHCKNLQWINIVLPFADHVIIHSDHPLISGQTKFNYFTSLNIIWKWKKYRNCFLYWLWSNSCQTTIQIASDMSSCRPLTELNHRFMVFVAKCNCFLTWKGENFGVLVFLAIFVNEIFNKTWWMVPRCMFESSLN